MDRDLVKAFRWACKTIVESKDDKGVEWAVEYAKYGLLCPIDEIHVQTLYILGNITHWRAPLAKQVRGVLKSVVR